MKTLLQIDLPYGCCFARIIGWDKPHRRALAFLLGPSNRDRRALTQYMRSQNVKPRKHLLSPLPCPDCLFNAIDVGLAHVYLFGDMGIHRQQRTDLPSRLITLPLSWLQQLANLPVFAVDEDVESSWRLRADRKHACRQVRGESILKHALEKVIKCGNEPACMQKQDIF